MYFFLLALFSFKGCVMHCRCSVYFHCLLLKGSCYCSVFCCTINMCSHYIKSCCLETCILVDSLRVAIFAAFPVYHPLECLSFLWILDNIFRIQHVKTVIWCKLWRSEVQVSCLVNSFTAPLLEVAQKVSSIAWVLCCEGVTRFKGNGHSSSGQYPAPH
jgi:hypothetical protein